MRSYFDTPQHREIADRITALRNEPGALTYNRPQIAIWQQIDADNRWHHENPGLSGSWRIGFNGDVMEGYGTPRFESEEAAVAYIDRELGPYPKVTAVYRPSRQTLDGLVAHIPVAA